MFADVAELELIAHEVRKRNALFQSVGMNWKHMKQVADTANPRMLFDSTLGGGDHSDESGLKRRLAVDRLAEGRDISGVAQVRGSGALLGLQALLPFRGKTWGQLHKADLAGRLAMLRTEADRTALVSEAKAEGSTGADPRWVHSLGKGDSPDHTMGRHNNIVALAEAAGEHWSETFLRLSDETDGRILFNYIGENQNLKALHDLFDGDRVFPGVGDAGAHVSMVMDAGWATFVLSHWIRAEGLFSMGEGIRRLTSGPARILGLQDRGALTPGIRADINVFDADNVAEGYPYRVHDFPGGAPRLTQGSIGYKATLVNGIFNLRDGDLTGQQAGAVIRHSH